MAFGEIIGAAVGILLLLIVAYLVVGSTLSTADIVTNTQKDVTQMNEARLNTDIHIVDAIYVNSTSNLHVNVTNTGNEILGDFSGMDVYVTQPATTPAYYSFNQTYGTDVTKTWKYSQITWADGSAAAIHLTQLDPGEMIWMEIDGFSIAPLPGSEVMVITGNGIKSSAMITIV